MTTSIAKELRGRRQRNATDERLMFEADLGRSLRDHFSIASRIQFPSQEYASDPVRFSREILGLDPWSKQCEILEMIRDTPRCAVSSGHKVGKSNTAAIAALWFYCSFEGARVVLSSTTSRQVDQILWRELKMLKARAGKCIACRGDQRLVAPCPHSAIIPEQPGELARTGLKAPDFREIVGFTAREAEAVAGVSGKNLLYLIDEASGVPDSIFEAIEGNRAGGARVVLFSNPTQTAGEFFEAFNDKKNFYATMFVSSEETPNVVEGREVIPGLATREWIEEKKLEWGPDSPLFMVRVKGRFAVKEDGRIFSIERIAQAERRWITMPDDSDARLQIGVDPSGDTGTGDDAAFCALRGKKALELVDFLGLDADEHVTQILAMRATWARPREKAICVIDAEGPVGSKLLAALRGVKGIEELFDIATVRASDGAEREPDVYHRMRDELTANLAQWFRRGGAIPENAKLTGEMHEMQWHEQVSGLLKVTPKLEIRRKLKRSPDRFDALALAAWVPSHLKESALTREKPADPLPAPVPRKLDPYAGIGGPGRRR